MGHPHKDTPESFKERMCALHGHDWDEVSEGVFVCVSCGANGVRLPGEPNGVIEET